ncbi:MAG TPA: DUF2306 domain-containing protein [Hyphomicrobiaceae bacterium]|nr:DUF2306 domain-containing protein [Hyphomicrobiaceae bacterium]
MNLAPLTNAPVPIQLHAYAALAAFALGIVQLAAPKGTIPHRALGYLWLSLMLGVAVSAFWIHEIRLWGPWSPIHLLAIYTLAMLPLGLYFARGHNVRGHQRTMLGLFFGALIIAGAFTLVPGRLMHKVVFGG